MDSLWDANRAEIVASPHLSNSLETWGGVDRLTDWWTAVDLGYLLRRIDGRRYGRRRDDDRRVKRAIYQARRAILELQDALRDRKAGDE